MMKRILNKCCQKTFRGMGLLGVVVALGVSATIIIAIPFFNAANQQERSNQLAKAQAHYSSIAALEYAMGQIYNSGDPSPFPTRQFHNTTISLTKSCSTITATASQNNATRTFTINHPLGDSSTQANCLTVDTSGSTLDLPNTRLRNIDLSKSSNSCCPSSITIQSINVNFTPNPTSINIKWIKIQNFKSFNGNPDVPAGTTCALSPVEVFSDATIHSLDEIRFNNTQQQGVPITFTLIFNMSDATSKTVVFTLTG